MKKYRCIPCGYIYDPALGDPDSGIAPGTVRLLLQIETPAALYALPAIAAADPRSVAMMLGPEDFCA